MATEKISGAEALIKSLIAEKTEYIFGYPGGAIMPVFDVLYDYRDKLKHILVRHEQGATHAAQGYARVSGKTGVVMVTSGPAATNIITGLSDAMMDSTPLIVILSPIGLGRFSGNRCRRNHPAGDQMELPDTSQRRNSLGGSKSFLHRRERSSGSCGSRHCQRCPNGNDRIRLQALSIHSQLQPLSRHTTRRNRGSRPAYQPVSQTVHTRRSGGSYLPC